jgi:hypothetical protein
LSERCATVVLDHTIVVWQVHPEEHMAKVYVEPRPKSREPHTAISHYVVEDAADSVLHSSQTQQGAVDWARRQGHRPITVARVRHLTNKKVPDHWREV